ncbi:MAG: phosphate ABC transporter substrate-binding protein PstS [Bryobacteraceae bacterium]|jgi:phosphate transport system substrate-binding protein
MTASVSKWIAILSLAFQIGGAATLRKLYVEPFTTNATAGKLREHTIAELRKLSSISLVDGESKADLILGGGGEIWVKGYQSLNPRSGRMPYDGTPVYGGYLSVELRDKYGDTLWSYLVTPGAGTGDISKTLSKRIVKHVAEAIEQTETPFRTAVLPQPKTILKGAGATFPQPVYAKWLTNYRRDNPDLEMTYDSIGSEAGVRKLLAGEVDFGASDSPEAIHEIAPSEENGYLLIPSVVGAVVPIVNLPGMSSEIAFTPETLSRIYLGKITKWNDPLLRQANPGVRLPDLDIAVVHRSDGSGTSYAFTDFLSKTSSDWKNRIGAGLQPKWPTGRAANGNEGVAQLVKEFGGSLGYVEFIYALRNHLTFGKVRNNNGEFVEASLESIAIAARQCVAMTDDLKVSIVNAPAPGAYPIASLTWFVVPAHIADNDKRNVLTGFLKWMLGPGQTQAAALGYLPLPKEIVSKARVVIAKIH